MTEPLYDDRVRPMLLAQASTRDAEEWNYDDAEQVIASLLARLDQIKLPTEERVNLQTVEPTTTEVEIRERNRANFIKTYGSEPSKDMLDWMSRIDMRPTIDQEMAALRRRDEAAHASGLAAREDDITAVYMAGLAAGREQAAKLREVADAAISNFEMVVAKLRETRPGLAEYWSVYIAPLRKAFNRATATEENG